MTPARNLAAAALTIALAAAPRAAHAHQPGISTGEIRLGLDTIRWEIRVTWDDWSRAFFLHGSPLTIRTEADVETARPEIERALQDLIGVSSDAGPCPGNVLGSRSGAFNGHPSVATTMEFACPAPPQSLTLRAPLAQAFLPNHRHLALLRGVREETTLLFGPGREEIQLEDVGGRLSPWRQVPVFLRLGIEHIFTGFDHVLFLIALVLGATGLRSLVAIVTSFTAGHTVTLAAATLGYVSLPPRVVEPLIAASIVYVGIENLVKVSKRRWLLTLAFGLVHGLGFSSVLVDMRIPRPLLATAVAGFNVGVEIGQVAIVGALYPALRAAARYAWHPRLVRYASAAVLLAGSYWLLERTAFAHAETTSYARIRVEGKSVQLQAWIDPWRLQPFVAEEIDLAAPLSEADLGRIGADVERLFAETFLVKAGTHYCAPRLTSVRQTDLSGHPYVTAKLAYACKKTVRDLTLDVRLPRRFGGSHRMEATLEWGERRERLHFDAEHETWSSGGKS
ncbi:MAG: HupE/UreJ family protein [Nitrospirae bacterium]|nr:HupE/UreJ family protein [Nitrospirota bacterium]